MQNCALIFNIPGQTFEIWQRDLKTVLEMGPDHISCYSLTVEKGTQLYQYVNRKEVSMPSEDQSAEFYQCAQSTMKESGFEQYEISNW